MTNTLEEKYNNMKTKKDQTISELKSKNEAHGEAEREFETF